jgi:7-carboxy-7-deazaguanine synthase
MFGQNEIVGKRYFKVVTDEAAKAKQPAQLMVTSMFYTLQGEGPFAGRPALFLRLAKCNLACSFCDTFFDQGTWMSFETIRNNLYTTLSQFWNDQGKCVPLWALPDNGGSPALYAPNIVLVITGGEPLLQDNLMAFLHFIKPHFNDIQIESNGILTPATFPEQVTLVCSPKCHEENGEAVYYFKPSLQMLNAAACLKFVMSADISSPYHTVPEWAHNWSHTTGRPVYVSPMNIYNDMPKRAKELRATRQNYITMEERSTIDEVVSFWEPGLLNMKANQANHEWAARYAITHGFRLSLQTHLMASLA